MDNLFVDTNNPELLASGTKYRKELLMQSLHSIESVYGKCTVRRPNVRGKEVVGSLINKAQLKPSTGAYSATDSTDIEFRTLETFMGDVIEEFQPLPMSKTIYGNSLSKNIKDFDIIKAITLSVANSVGGNLRNALFSAKRKATGTTTMDLFDGFYTILKSEITAETISADNGNYVELAVLTQDNIIDELKKLYRAASLNLRQNEHVQLMLQPKYIDMYRDAYLIEVGAAPYNNKFEQIFLIGSSNRCEIMPVYDESEDAPVFITIKNNMVIGCDQVSQEEKVMVRTVDNPHTLQFFMVLYFGVQFERIDKDYLIVGVQVEPESDSDSNSQQTSNN